MHTKAKIVRFDVFLSNALLRLVLHFGSDDSCERVAKCRKERCGKKGRKEERRIEYNCIFLCFRVEEKRREEAALLNF